MLVVFAKDTGLGAILWCPGLWDCAVCVWGSGDQRWGGCLVTECRLSGLSPGASCSSRCSGCLRSEKCLGYFGHTVRYGQITPQSTSSPPHCTSLTPNHITFPTWPPHTHILDGLVWWNTKMSSTGLKGSIVEVQQEGILPWWPGTRLAGSSPGGL